MSEASIKPEPVTPAAGAAITARLARDPGSRWSALPVLMAGTFLIVLDFFIVNVALPSIQVGLHAGTGAIEWVIVGYGLAFSVFLITSGRVGDRIGRRRLFSIGLALFGLTSAACGLAPNAGVLVAGRLLQGLAAAMISPNVLSIIGVLYAGADRAKAISVYGMVLGIAAAGGQLIGGALIQANVAGLGWRAIFLINLPVAAVALGLARRLVPESRAEHAKSIDTTGIVLVTLGLTAVLLPLVEGRAQGWPPWTWVSLGLALIVLAALGVHQVRLAARGGEPLLNPALLSNRVFRAGLFTQLVYWCTQASFYLILAFYLQQGLGLDPLHAGLVFTILAGAYLAMSLRAPALTVRYGPTLITVGALALAVGFGLLIAGAAVVKDGSSIGFLAPGLALIGSGMGLCITPLTMTVLAHATPQTAGGVSGALATMQQVGNSLGAAITGVIFFGALGGGYARAFELALLELAGLAVVVAVLTGRLPRPGRPA